MLKGILGFFAFLFFLAVLILMLTGSYILKKVRTIIDNRHQERENKKIFDDSDGEYVDFVEER